MLKVNSWLSSLIPHSNPWLGLLKVHIYIRTEANTPLAMFNLKISGFGGGSQFMLTPSESFRLRLSWINVCGKISADVRCDAGGWASRFGQHWTMRAQLKPAHVLAMLFWFRPEHFSRRTSKSIIATWFVNHNTYIWRPSHTGCAINKRRTNAECSDQTLHTGLKKNLRR